MRSPKCPECGHTVSLRLLWDVSPKDHRAGIIALPVGIVCAGCGARLQLVQWRAAILFLSSCVLFAACAGTAARWLGVGQFGTVAAVALVLAAVICLNRLVWSLGVQLRLRTGLRLVDFPIERLKAEMALVASGQDLPSPAMMTTAASYWACIRCGEPNPETSRLCLTCGEYNQNAR